MRIVLALMSNPFEYPYQPIMGPIAIAPTWTLGCGAMVFVLARNALAPERAPSQIG
jgi:hypothetical protein